MELRLPGRPGIPGLDIPSQEAEGTLFLLKVIGDSMINAAIADGDWVVVRQQDAQDGDIVAAMLDGEATVKSFKRSDGHAWLIAALPGTLRIAKVHLDVGCQGEALVVGQFGTAIPGQGAVQFLGQPLGLFDQCRDHRVRIAVGDLGEH